MIQDRSKAPRSVILGATMFFNPPQSWGTGLFFGVDGGLDTVRPKVRV